MPTDAHSFAHCKLLQDRESSGTEIEKALEIKGNYKKIGEFANNCIALLYPQQESNPYTDTPYFQGSNDISENASTLFNTHQNYFELILDLFDKLDSKKQIELVNILASRIRPMESVK